MDYEIVVDGEDGASVRYRESDVLHKFDEHLIIGFHEMDETGIQLVGSHEFGDVLMVLLMNVTPLGALISELNRDNINWMTEMTDVFNDRFSKVNVQ